MIRAACGPAVILILVIAGWAADPPGKAEVVKAGKPACALVDTPKGYGSAFCVDADGYFITNEHVVAGMGKGSKLKVVLNAGEKEQEVADAVVVRTDPATDLALLKVDAKGRLPALALGDDEKLSELDELIGFGFPFGKEIVKSGDYPSITVSAATISSLRRDKDRRLDRIQMDAALNPGNSGGPVVNRSGEVVGVVVSGIRGSGLAQAIPVSHVKRFLEKPEITIVAPDVDPKNKFEKGPYCVQVLSIPERKEGMTVDLLVRSDGRERQMELKREARAFEGVIAPFEKADRPPQVQVEIRYPDGSVKVPVSDVAVKVGGKEYRLSQIGRVRLGKVAAVQFADGTAAEVEFGGLEKVEVSLPGQSAAFTTAGALELIVTPPVSSKGGYLLTAVARRNGKEIGRAEEAKYLKGMEPSGIEGLLQGHFTKPTEAPKTRTAAALVSTGGEPLGAGKSYKFTETQFRVSTVDGGGVLVTFEHTDPKTRDPQLPARFASGFLLTVSPPRGGILDARQYPSAVYPAQDSGITAGLQFHGEGRTCNSSTGKFAVWEVEILNGTVRTLAVDFILYPNGKTDTPLVGSIRYRSKYE